MSARAFADRARAAAPRYDAVIPTPVVHLKLGLVFQDEALSSIDFLDETVPERGAEDAHARYGVAQVRAYFADPRTPFTLALAPVGTPFQRCVWAALRSIPVGETRRYGELARQLDSAPRAIGGACRANPIPLVVPCHRVVAAGGDGGFMGRVDGPELALKRWLLQHEQARS